MSDQSARKKVKRFHLRGTSTKLLDLNDDCFFEIFQHLHPKDFLEIANVCRRLKTLAQDYFTLKCKDCSLYNCASFRGRYWRGSCVKARNLLSNFGGCIQKIELRHPWLLYPCGERVPKKLKNFKLPLIIKYCTNLTHVTIHGFAITSRDTEMWKSFFAYISTLKLQNCQFVNVTLFFVLSLCPKLKHLKMYRVDEVHSNTTIDTKSIPTNLEMMEISDCSMKCIRHRNLIRLLENNVNLRKLSYIDYPQFGNDINVEEIKRLFQFQEIDLRVKFPRMSASVLRLSEGEYIELDDDHHGSTDELDCYFVCNDEKMQSACFE